MKNLILPFSLLVLSASLIVSALLVRNGLLAVAGRQGLPQSSAPARAEPFAISFYPFDDQRPGFQPMLSSATSQIQWDVARGISLQEDNVTSRSVVRNYPPVDPLLPPAGYSDLGTIDLTPPAMLTPASSPAAAASPAH